MSIALPPVTILSNSQSVDINITGQPYSHLEIFNQCGFPVLLSGINNGSMYLMPGQDRVVPYIAGAQAIKASGVNNGVLTGRLIITGYSINEPILQLGIAGSITTITAGTIDANVTGGTIGVSSLPSVVLAAQTLTVASLSSTDSINIADSLAPANKTNGITLSTSSQTVINGPAILRTVTWSGVTGVVTLSLAGNGFATIGSANDGLNFDLYIPSGDSVTVTSSTAAGSLYATATTL